jgi:hypothetical protein
MAMLLLEVDPQTHSVFWQCWSLSLVTCQPSPLLPQGLDVIDLSADGTLPGCCVHPTMAVDVPAVVATEYGSTCLPHTATSAAEQQLSSSINAVQTLAWELPFNKTVLELVNSRVA